MMPYNTLIRILDPLRGASGPTRFAAQFLLALGVVAIFAIALAQLSKASDRLPGIIGVDDRQPVASTDLPWAAIGRINRESGGFCTGEIGRAHV